MSKILNLLSEIFNRQMIALPNSLIQICKITSSVVTICDNVKFNVLIKTWLKQGVFGGKKQLSHVGSKLIRVAGG